jgi:hypothetical protein
LTSSAAESAVRHRAMTMLFTFSILLLVNL